jgi:predicted RNA-binding protein with PIN domain
MIILVDAYNVLKTVLHSDYITDRERYQFLQLFEKYAQLRPSNEIILVFDGGHSLYDSQEHDYKITLIYSGALLSADDIIKKKIIKYKTHDLLLVTCDRDIKRHASEHNVEALGSVKFYTLVQDIVQQHDQHEEQLVKTAVKTSEAFDCHVDALMEIGSRKLMIKEQDAGTKISLKSIFGRCDAKKDKKLFKKIIKI